MHWLQLIPRKENHPSDHEYMAKLPLMPYKFLYESQNHVLALHQPDEGEGPLYLQTDHDGFFEAYRKYYQERFEVEEKEEDFNLPEGYSVLIGRSHQTEPSEEE